MSAVAVASPQSNSRRRMSAEAVLELWEQYRETGDRAVRDRLVLTFAPMVKYIVYKKVREMPARCEVEDFISCGLEALIQSIDRYDASKGATLEQYAWTRIHGAVLDELRRQDWAPRSVRQWERDMSRATETLTVLHGRAPSVDELAEALGVTVQELRHRRDEIQRSDVTSLNSMALTGDDTSIERIDTIASSDDSYDPVLSAARREAKVKFREAFAQLPKREREVAVLLYVKHLTLAEIGDILGVSESRVCQIHAQLKRRLRTSLRSDAQLFQLVS